LKAHHLFVCSLLIPFSCSIKDAEENTVNTIEADGFCIEMLDNRLTDILDLDTPIEIIADGHEWTEGPLWLESQQMLLYSDIPRNTIYSWKEGEEAELYLDPSGFTGDNFAGSEPGSNGLLLNTEGQLVLCQHGDRRLAVMTAPIDDPEPLFETLTDNFEGRRLNSPNDAVFRSNGDLYFTDPPYGLPQRMDDSEKELDFQGVYLRKSSGEVALITDQMTRPNGIGLSPDEKTLYVANSDPDMAIWKMFTLDESGLPTSESIFYDATNEVGEEPGLPDGLKVGKNGIIYATGPGGILIFAPDGTLLGIIHTGQATANCALNTDESVLFITADMYVLRVGLE
jgi:gluconolactonase